MSEELMIKTLSEIGEFRAKLDGLDSKLTNHIEFEEKHMAEQLTPLRQCIDANTEAMKAIKADIEEIKTKNAERQGAISAFKFLFKAFWSSIGIAFLVTYWEAVTTWIQNFLGK